MLQALSKAAQMIEIDSNLWVFNGGNVSFLSFPFSTRMTVVRLSDGRLWVHSPVELSSSLQQQIDELGEVAIWWRQIICITYLFSNGKSNTQMR